MPHKASVSPGVSPDVSSRRVDLHCHSRASTEADEAVLIALQCPESYSEPAEVYAQAKQRGMDFVTITDHDSIAGVSELLHHDDVLVGEELTCYFREDHCKIHLLVWGITRDDHDQLQSLADDIELVADFVADNRIAHAVAHPLYRQNGKLDRWHLEKLLLLFNGFESLNGAHSALHRDAIEPVIADLDEATVRRLARVHGLRARWPRPWRKTRTGGSDDHGLFNIGRTYTEFPAGVKTTADLLACIRSGDCRPGGETGTSVKLAHNFYGVGVRYYTRQIASPKSITSAVLKKIVGEKSTIRKSAMALHAAKHVGGKLIGRAATVVGLKRRRRGTALLSDLLLKSASQRMQQHRSLFDLLKIGQAPLAEHGPMFDLISDVNRDVARGLGDAVTASLGRGQIDAIFDAVSTVLAHQSLLLPYYFALFHQNQERHLLSRITGRPNLPTRDTIRVGLFTDVFAGNSAAGRFAQTLAHIAADEKLDLVTHTCGEATIDDSLESICHFRPLLETDLAGTKLVIPPVLEMLERADRQQFDVILANTPGPMGLAAMLVAKMLRVPLLNVMHDDLPTVVHQKSNGDYRLAAAAKQYAGWFNASAKKILLRSRAAVDAARGIGVAESKTAVLPQAPSFDAIPPQPGGKKFAFREPIHLICPLATMSANEKRLLVDAFAQIRFSRKDVALVLLGEPDKKSTDKKFNDLPVYHINAGDDSLDHWIACADLVLHPSASDASAQVIVDAQAAGVPVVVAAKTTAAEMLDDGLTGTIVPESTPAAWAGAILDLLNDEPRRQRMARTGPPRVGRLSPARLAGAVWSACLDAVNDSQADDNLARAGNSKPQSPVVEAV